MKKITKPEDITPLVAALKNTEEERLRLDKQSGILKKVEDKLKSTIIEKINEGAVCTKDYVVTVEKRDKPVAVDWHKIWKYIRTNDAFDLLHKRLTETAVEARWGEGVEVPGVDKLPVEKLYVTTL